LKGEPIAACEAASLGRNQNFANGEGLENGKSKQFFMMSLKIKMTL